MVLDVSAGKESLESLQKLLLEMPKPGAERSGKSTAILPGLGYAPQRQAPDEDPDEDDD